MMKWLDYEFQDRDGRWRYFCSQQDYENTRRAGIWNIRPIPRQSPQLTQPAPEPKSTIDSLPEAHEANLRAEKAQKYDDVLLPFFAMMRAELHSNADKGDRPGWLEMDNKTALLEIFYHLAKLQKAVKNGDAAGIKEYAADVANMAMMLVDINGLLAPVDEVVVDCELRRERF